jgi:starch synthase
MSIKPTILLAAAENGNLTYLKVGGEADVVRGASLALAESGVQVVVCNPSAMPAAELPEAQHIAEVSFQFGGRSETADAYAVPGIHSHPNLRQVLLCHSSFPHQIPGKGYVIYTDDPADQPFATDATKFARFSAAVAAGVELGLFGVVGSVHIHDWHLGNLAVIRRYNPGSEKLRSARCVMSIHNAAMQGVRPFEGAVSSFTAWFPHLLNGNRAVLADPRWPSCYNPLAAGIRLADAVHVVSPTYAEEVLRPSDPDHGFYGGEGLERALMEAKAGGRLVGILNGCDYSTVCDAVPANSAELLRYLRSLVLQWTMNEEVVSAAHFLAHSRLSELAEEVVRPRTLLTSIGRISDQKCLLMKQPLRDGRPALWHILERLAKTGLLVLLGSGDKRYEKFFIQTSLLHDNFVLLSGFSSAAANALYTRGDIFLMPSSFEPCGIAQMMAMAHGQPCVVHGVGGLKDTVKDGETGFVFTGATPQEQAENFVQACERALRLKQEAPGAWQTLRQRAAAQRFLWADAAAEYASKLYRLHS